MAHQAGRFPFRTSGGISKRRRDRLLQFLTDTHTTMARPVRTIMVSALEECVNQHGSDGDTCQSPLIVHAIRKNRLITAKRRIRRGDDPYAMSCDGTDAMIAAAFNHEHGAELLRLMFSMGVDPNFMPESVCPNPYITFAVESNNVEAVKAFIDAGANLDTPNEDGCTPLETAQDYGFHEMADLLQQHQ